MLRLDDDVYDVVFDGFDAVFGGFYGFRLVDGGFYVVHLVVDDVIYNVYSDNAICGVGEIFYDLHLAIP